MRFRRQLPSRPQECPRRFGCAGNWPNPFNASTTIAFDVERTAPVHLVVYDVLGRRVRVLHGGETLTAGQYRTAWNGRDDEGPAGGLAASICTDSSPGKILLRWDGWLWFAKRLLSYSTVDLPPLSPPS